MRLPLLLLLTALLTGCASIPISYQTLAGRYEMIGKPQGLWYAGESLLLGADGSFQYRQFTDFIDDPKLPHYPLVGRYTIEGKTLTLHNNQAPSPTRLIIPHQKHFTLWTERQRESFRQTAKVPDDVLEKAQ